MDSSFLLRICLAAIGFFMLLATILFIVIRRFGFRQNDETVASSASHPSSLSHNWTHQVFPSFRGEDVRKDFLSHIKKEFQRKGITIFIDNEIRRGESIGHDLVQAIKGSKIAVVLLSRNYASSSWCLNELVEIMKCREDLGQTVMVIFYKVDPSDVKKLMGDFGKAFRKTCKGKTKEDTERWRRALEKVATIAGYHSNDWDNEADMVKKIVIDVSNVLNNSTQSSDFDDFVGMGAHMEKIGRLLRLNSEEVRMIGIWGLSGIGKSTIARSVFNKYSHQFPLSVYMENIKTRYPRPCYDEYSAKLQLQEEFLSRITNHKDIKIHHLGVAEDRLKDKRVLVVLDDVDQLVQLEAMAKETQWFGHGSRIIITTEDLKLLKAHRINHIYKVDFPLTDHALQIFCIHAFGQKYPYDGFQRLAWEVTDIVGNLPLGLKVMGSYFRGMSKQEWTEALPGLRTRLDAGIQSILKFSYDALDDKDKDLFLHIACFFDGERHDQMLKESLAKNFSDVSQGLRVLVEKSLISINFWGRIEMPTLLAQLAREIVRKQSIHDPGQRQFLFDANEICEVLTDGTDSRSVIGIDLDLSDIEQELKISERGFEGMSNLQFLRLWDCPFHKVVCSPRSLNYLSRKLRILHWDCFPMTSFPSEFHTEFLVIIYMHYSKLEKLWEGIQSLRNLQLMCLDYSANLKELPNLSSATNLQRLSFVECSSLLELPYSIGKATNLHDLDLYGCSSLIQLPTSIGNATYLQKIDFTKCSSLVKLPYSFGNLINLRKLKLSECSSLVELPSSIGNAITDIENLDLSGCTSLVELPSSIGNAFNLKKLDLSECSSLVKLPSSIGNAKSIQELNLRACSSLVELPSSIGNAINIHELNLRECSSLKQLPFSIGNVTYLQEFTLSGCSSLVEIPSSIGNAKNLQKLNLDGCSSLTGLPSSIGDAIELQILDLRYCSNLVDIPSSIGSLHKLEKLTLSGCSKLEILPTNINLESLNELDLTGCVLLKSFPVISTNIEYLDVRGTAIKEVPSSIKLWSRLDEFYMP